MRTGDDGLRKLLGLRGPGVKRNGKRAAPEDTNGRVSQLEAKIEETATADIVDLLAGEPLAVLKEVAGHRGIRTLSKERKLDLVRRITTHAENQRGYTLLRGNDSQPSP